jgi:hypothetical protein
VDSHVARIVENELHKNILCTNPGGQWRRGRPKSRWTDEVKKDARKVGCRNWLTAAQDRSRWRYLLEAKAHLGLYSRYCWRWWSITVFTTGQPLVPIRSQLNRTHFNIILPQTPVISFLQMLCTQLSSSPYVLQSSSTTSWLAHPNSIWYQSRSSSLLFLPHLPRCPTLKDPQTYILTVMYVTHQVSHLHKTTGQDYSFTYFNLYVFK